MARLHLLALFDRVSETFMPPFVAPTLGVAERQIRDELMRPDSELGKHPEDYSLVELGIFDNGDGSVWCEKGLAEFENAGVRRDAAVITQPRDLMHVKNLLPVKS